MKEKYSLTEVTRAINGRLLTASENLDSIVDLLTDSRKLLIPKETLFFALPGIKLDGHDYISELYEKGVRAFVISKEIKFESYPKAAFIAVKDVKYALQKLAQHHRSKFSYPIIGITGSNGKTIVKEWLFQLLNEDYNIVRSPKSYNSQIGVPLSLWLMDEGHNLGIFEAGISESGEMEQLERLIQPTIGIFTNIGDAHGEGFLSVKHKIKEKLKLFIHCQTLIYNKDNIDVNECLQEIIKQSKLHIELIDWSWSKPAFLSIQQVLYSNGNTLLICAHEQQLHNFVMPFSDRAGIENAVHCICAMLFLGYSADEIQRRLNHLSRIEMRLEVKEAINDCSLINDTYNLDLESLKNALGFLNQQVQNPTKSVIISEILQSGLTEINLYEQVRNLMVGANITRFIGIGKSYEKYGYIFRGLGALRFIHYETVNDFIKNIILEEFDNEAILVKGARKFEFERITSLLEKKTHSTVLEIDLNAVLNNLKVFQGMLPPETKIMAMVKGFGYGSGFELANELLFNHCNYLAVAYVDEGIELRKNRITLPIMVMNPEIKSFEQLKRYNLEPNIFSLSMLKKLIKSLGQSNNSSKPIRIHLEIETGMNRLGINTNEVDDIIKLLLQNESIQIASIFSHLSASDNQSYDDFTKHQIELFDQISTKFCRAFTYKILRHILNSAGIFRWPMAHFDMVRLGIGLYGILPSTQELRSKILNVATLKTTISQIKQIKKGESVGYERAGWATDDKTIATVCIGYADGLPRILSQGKISFFVKNKFAPVIGNICMDMTMIDISGIDGVIEGEQVIVFGRELSIVELAKAAGTIPYEILTGISTRVPRIYFKKYDSISRSNAFLTFDRN